MSAFLGALASAPGLYLLGQFFLGAIWVRKRKTWIVIAIAFSFLPWAGLAVISFVFGGIAALLVFFPPILAISLGAGFGQLVIYLSAKFGLKQNRHWIRFSNFVDLIKKGGAE